MELIELLQAHSGISAWRVVSEQVHSCELYFVKDRLETNREVDTNTATITVYVDKDGKRGASSFPVYAYMGEKELAEEIEKNLYAASFAMDPYYPLPMPEALPGQPETVSDCNMEELLAAAADAVFSVDCGEGGSMNATEFFLHKTTLRVQNSNGVDLSHTSYSGMIEMIPSRNGEGDAVEVYHQARFEIPDPAGLRELAAEQLRYAHDRYLAKPLSEVAPGKDTFKVILQDEEPSRLFGDYFAEDLSYSAKYMHYNHFEIGDRMQGDRITGTPLNLKMVPSYPGSVGSCPFDGDGVVTREQELIKDGVAVGMYGDFRSGKYLGIERPTGKLHIMVVEPGTKPYSEMVKEPYLRCVKFSGLQVDSDSGYLGGEVRLGYYFDGEKEIPVTGFTVSGDLHALAGSIVYSEETITRPNYHGPRYLEIPGMTAQ